MGGVGAAAGSRGSTARMRSRCAGSRCSEARALRGTAARMRTCRGTARRADPRAPPDPEQHLGAEPDAARALPAEPRCGSSSISPWRRNFRLEKVVALKMSHLFNYLHFFFYFMKIKESSHLHSVIPLYIYTPFYKLPETQKNPNNNNNKRQVPG